MNITYMENVLTPEAYRDFQRKMHWNEDPYEQISLSLNNDLYDIVALDNGELVGMGRLIGDGAIFWYIQDVFILTEYQGKGIGSAIVKKLIDHAKKSSIPKTEISLCLMCAKGKEGFYEKLGFRCRPHEYEGPGMEMEIAID
ncbi:MAG: GNAT family N-acetyltransferase [Oscillospiraceae bacterium]